MAFASESSSLSRILLYLAIFIGSRIVYVLCYRLIFHPLARIPGPKLAAATFFYQTYYSFIPASRFYAQIGKLHRIYGPVIRITPDEIHLSDPENYDTVYNVVSRYPKSPRFYNSFGLRYSSFAACSNEIHRLRRSAIQPMFSRKQVLELESVVQGKADKLCALVARKFAAGQPVDLHHAFRAVSIDVITDYGFNKCYDLLDSSDLGRQFFLMVRGIGPALWIFQQWPWLSVMNNLPPWMLKKISPPLAQILALQEHAKEQVLNVKADIDSGRVKESSRRTLFHHLLTPNPEEGYVVPSVDDIKDEAYGILAAAADTTGNAMTVAARNVVNNPVIYKKLVAELKGAFPDPNAKLDFQVLEKLPYLTGVIKEGLRLSFGVIGRMPRIVPEGGATYNGYTVPTGTAVSMSSWVLHQDEMYFPDPLEFNPDRWANIADVRRMEKAFVPFGKGSRICVGMPLAYCELYITIGTLFRRFENLRGNELSAEDLVYDDFFGSHNPIDSRKFHVLPPETEV